MRTYALPRRRRDIRMCRNETYGVAFDAVDATKLSDADADPILQHGFKHRLKIAG